MTGLLATALAQGAAIAALAFGFALVYWSARTFFLALGALYALAPLVAGELRPGAGWTVAVTAAVGAATGLALVVGWLNHELLARRQAPPGVHFVSSLALYYTACGLLTLRWGSEPRSLVGVGTLDDAAGGGWPAASQRLVIGACLGLVAVVGLALRGSGNGVKLRALADNAAELARSGARPAALRAAAFAVAGGCAGVTAVASAFDHGIAPSGGMAALLPAAAATLLTPVGRWWLLLGWSLGLGFLLTAVPSFLSGAWQDPLTLGLLLLALVGRRAGGRRWQTAAAVEGAR